MTITLYGIPNCDTVKKARTWLSAQGFDYDFHDYKKVGAPADRLQFWCDAKGWEVLLNRAGTTFRALPDEQKNGLEMPKAIALMLAQPSMIKRPVLEYTGGILVGFKPDEWQAAFGE